MATGGSNIVKIKIVGPNKTYEGNITTELAAMINAPDCDPELKKVVYGAIIRNTGNEDPFDTVQAVLPVNPENEPGSTNVQPESPAETENPPVQQITDSVNNLNICDKKQKKKEKKKIKKKTKKFIKGLSKEQLMERNLNANIATHEKLYLYRQKVIHATKCTPDYSDEETIHNWTEKEEKLLMTIRGDMEDAFNGTKQHDTLWGKIVKQMNQEGVTVSSKQILVKKKKKSGNVVVEKFSTADEDAPGTSSSTKPRKESVKRMKKETKCKSDRISTIITEIQDTNNNVVNLMKEQHGDRIKRMDRLLDILEKSIDKE
ncbi:Hypothetical predicted protein [Mytilus galloprovincialis]|uniref:Myb/SANT-like DNA-binding domain-containing protein n=1 Tax=Mytilus galloprovincialis TaxID=29158 RepID=A0A8B6GJG4_MYTGA|nr:Hypothetical predicted protein [Mytilus galloprovincialis]